MQRRARPETEPISLLKRFGAESSGTFALTLTAAGTDVLGVVTGGAVSPEMRVLAPALTILAFVYTLGKVSGAHFNPAVTFAFALHGCFPWRLAPVYVAAELAGAVAAALLLRALFGPAAAFGINVAHLGAGTALTTEILLTFLLVSVVLGTAKQHRLLGPDAAIPVAGIIAAAGVIGIRICGPSMNPARSFGPALVAGNTGDLWLYLVGPLAGAALATLAARALHGRGDGEEAEAATGDAA